MHSPVKSGLCLCFWGVSRWLQEVELRPGRSLGFRESLELQNGGLRALEEAWTITSRLRHFPVKFGCFVCFRRCWKLKVRGWRLKGGGWKLRVEGWKLRVLEAQDWRLEAQGRRLEAQG